MRERHVSLTRKNRIATITLHGEKSLNIMGRALLEALVRVLEKLRQSGDVGVVVITGPLGGSLLTPKHSLTAACASSVPVNIPWLLSAQLRKTAQRMSFSTRVKPDHLPTASEASLRARAAASSGGGVGCTLSRTILAACL